MDLPIYRPNSDKTKGFAVQFKKSANKRGLPCLRVEAALQTGEKPPPGSTESPFDWENKLTMSIELGEIGQLMAVTQCRQNDLKLYHKFQEKDGNVKDTSLSVQWTEYQGKKNLTFNMSQKRGDDSKNVRLFLSQGEVSLWQEMMSMIVREYYASRISRS